MATSSSVIHTLLLILLYIQLPTIESSPIGSAPHFDWQYSAWSKQNELRSEIAMGKINSQPFSTNMEYILYDSNLEQIPLNHALQCNYTYNTQLNYQIKQIKNNLSFKIFEGVLSPNQFGENIAYHTIGPFLDSNNLQNIIQQQWFDIHQYYDYTNNQCDSTQDCSPYQKLLWAKTRYMACGVSICPFLYLPNNKQISEPVAFIVCNYFPTYDKHETPIYKTKTIPKIKDNVCTQCSTDRQQCENGLCYGCPARNYTYCQDRLLICEESKDKCSHDTIIYEYCAYTCWCDANDWISDAQCDNLYLTAPTKEPTIAPVTSNKCERLGWFNVLQLENNPIQCPNGYMLPYNNKAIQYIENNCLNDGDIGKLNVVVNGHNPHGIAMGWTEYNKGCDWDINHKHGVILTYSGYKCGDSEQLFICVYDYTHSPTIHSYTTINPTTSTIITTEVITSNPSEEPSNIPTSEPTEFYESELPTSAPTEGPTFSPTKEPTNEPTDTPTGEPTTMEPTTHTPTNVMPTIETTVAMEYDPFKMYLLFPEQVKIDQQMQSVRRLQEDIHVRRMIVDDNYIELYPDGVDKLWPMKYYNKYGYEFNLSKKIMNENVNLNEIVYTIDRNVCQLDMNTIGTLIKFNLFKKYKNEWNDIGLIEYNVKLKKNTNHEWIDIIIEIINGYMMEYDVLYKFVIDVSLLLNGCQDLLHPIYVKTFGNFSVEKNNFMVNGLRSVILSNDNKEVYCKYWMKMSMIFN